MREIKFRLIKDNKIVGYEWHRKSADVSRIEIFHSTDGNEWFNTASNHNPYSFIDHDTKNQYIGQDKNGVEIYEVDIIKCNYCDKDFGEVIYYENMTEFSIKWSEKACANAHLTRIGYWCEVKGNVFENPELLTNK